METIFDPQMAGLTIAPIECQFITDSESLDGVDLLVSKGWNHSTLTLCRRQHLKPARANKRSDT